MKTKKRFLSILLSLALLLGMFPGMSLTAYAADTTVTWNASDIVTEHPWDDSFTKDGITFAPGMADFLDKNFADGGTFTTASGKFTKIVVTAPSVNISGTGWSGGTWTGDASSSVSYSGSFYDAGMGQLKIVFTIETTPAHTHSFTYSASAVRLIPGIKPSTSTRLSRMLKNRFFVFIVCSPPVRAARGGIGLHVCVSARSY